jgi:hypothetical protein
MVCAILAGTKTQTRRVAKLTVAGHVKEIGGHRRWHPTDPEAALACPYGQPGDRLWVRETWAEPTSLDPGPTFYWADYPECVPAQFSNVPPASAIKWKPSIHMRRDQSRITLENAGVRLERLMGISEADADAEGVVSCDGLLDETEICRFASAMRLSPEECKPWYAALWESINGRGSWDANPWVWVVEFKRVEGGATCEK